MKKLMIAAAAAAMVGGAYATEGCVDCGNIVVKPVQEVTEVEIDDCFTEVYNVQFKLKTLASKGVKSGDCQGWCMEQGTRTIDGILWSCCSDCANWAGNQEADWNFQYCLWEKSSKTLFTDGLTHLNGQQDKTTGGRRYTVTSRYLPSGNIYLASDFVYDTAADANAARTAQIALLNAQYGTTAVPAPFAAGIATLQKPLAVGEVDKVGYRFVWRKVGVADVQKIVEPTYSAAAGNNDARDAYRAELTPDGTAPAYAGAGDWTAWALNADGTVGAQLAGNQRPGLAASTLAAGDPARTTLAGNQKFAYSITALANALVAGWSAVGVDCDADKAAAAAPDSLQKGLTKQDFVTAGWYANVAAVPAAVPDAFAWTLVPGTTTTTSVADAACENVEPGFRSRYLDTQANIAVYRYGKKADKAEALWVIDTENDAQAGAGLKDENNLILTAAGFGTVAMDKDYEQYYVKSLSGNCAGAITPLNVAADCAGAIISMCDELGSWCTDGWVATIADTFASGTWTMKYIAKAKNGIWGLVPSYAK